MLERFVHLLSNASTKIFIDLLTFNAIVSFVDFSTALTTKPNVPVPRKF